MISTTQDAEKGAISAVLDTVLAAVRDKKREQWLGNVLPKSGVTISAPSTNDPLERGALMHVTFHDIKSQLLFDSDAVIVEEPKKDEAEIWVDRDLAVAWVPYERFVNGKLRLIGTNIVTLIKQASNGQWIMAGVTDTVRLPGDPGITPSAEDVKTVRKLPLEFVSYVSKPDRSPMADLMMLDGFAVRIREGEQVFDRLSDVLASLEAIPYDHFKEIAHSIEVRVTQDLALAWIPTTVTMDGKLFHEGTNVFSMVKRNGVWKICSIFDNSWTDESKAVYA